MSAVTFTPITFKKILVATDLTDASAGAIAYATAIAKQFDGHLQLVHVSEPLNAITTPESEWFEDATSHTEEQVEAIGVAQREEGVQAETVNLIGNVTREIVSIAQKQGVDLVVLGTRGRKGFDRLLFGSEAENLMRRLSCPVMAVGPSAAQPLDGAWVPKIILCATNMSSNEIKTLEYAYRLAQSIGAKLTIFSVSDTESGDQKSESFTPSRRLPNTEIKVLHIPPGIEGEPAAMITKVARESNAGLLVMSAKESHWPVSHFAPGVLGDVLAMVPCPVLTLAVH